MAVKNVSYYIWLLQASQISVPICPPVPEPKSLRERQRQTGKEAQPRQNCLKAGSETEYVSCKLPHAYCLGALSDC